MTSKTVQNQLNTSSLNYSDEQLSNVQQQIQTNMQQMSGQDQTGLNAIYANLINQLTCDSDCQKRQQIDELRNTWKAAQSSQKNAPNVTIDAEKNYLIAYEGVDGYNNTMFKRYSGVAETAQKNATQSNKQVMKEIVALNSDYDAETKSLSQVKELLNIKLAENSRLLELVDTDIASVETNDRKVVYEDWAKEWLRVVNKALYWIYIVTALVFIYKSPFIQNSKWKTFTGWLLPIGLFIYPYLIYYIAAFILNVYKQIKWFMSNKAPKNVYSRL